MSDDKLLDSSMRDFLRASRTLAPFLQGLNDAVIDARVSRVLLAADKLADAARDVLRPDRTAHPALLEALRGYCHARISPHKTV